jgi:hypothetical protein
MNRTTTPDSLPACGRGADLVTYLYNEASRDERASFERHLPECPACRTELKAFESVRSEMKLWQVPFAPRLDIAPKNRWQMLRELSGLFPFWTRIAAAGALATAAALVFFSLIGTRLSVGAGGVSIAFGKQPNVIQSDNTKPAPKPDGMLTRAEAEHMIEQAVAEIRAKQQTETETQLASLEQRLSAAHEARLANVTRKLHHDYRQMMANLNNQPSLREWLFAASDDGTEVKGNEKSN